MSTSIDNASYTCPEQTFETISIFTAEFYSVALKNSYF